MHVKSDLTDLFESIFFYGGGGGSIRATKHLTNDLKGRTSSILEQLMLLALSVCFVHKHMESDDFGWVLGRDVR